MLLPHRERAVLDLRKPEDYCLDPSHPRGRHKARVFRDALGLSRTDSRWLRDILLAGVREQDGFRMAEDGFGVRRRVDVRVRRQAREAMVRSVWIVPIGQDAPRFVTRWVL
jgi:hypothetical protein